MGNYRARLKRDLEALAAASWSPADCRRSRRTEGLEGEGHEAGLAGLLAALEAHLERSLARSEALESLLFGLRHLFHLLADLYQQRLPALGEATRFFMDGLVPPNDLPTRHAVWLALRAVSRDLGQCDLLCKLLTSASGALLDLFDLGALSQAAVVATSQPVWPAIASASPPRCCPLWLRQQLTSWQEGYQRLPPFVLQFGPGSPLSAGVTTECSAQLDRAFALLLEEAGAIFGDLLPGLAQEGASRQQGIPLFLLDLAQHGEQILLILDGLWDPLDAMSEAFGLEAFLGSSLAWRP